MAGRDESDALKVTRGWNPKFADRNPKEVRSWNLNGKKTRLEDRYDCNLIVALPLFLTKERVEDRGEEVFSRFQNRDAVGMHGW